MNLRKDHCTHMQPTGMIVPARGRPEANHARSDGRGVSARQRSMSAGIPRSLSRLEVGVSELIGASYEPCGSSPESCPSGALFRMPGSSLGECEGGVPTRLSARERQAAHPTVKHFATNTLTELIDRRSFPESSFGTAAKIPRKKSTKQMNNSQQRISWLLQR